MPRFFLWNAAPLALACLASSCSPAPRPHHEAVRPRGIAATWPPTADLANGRNVFGRECSACHGRNGAGGPVGPALRGEGLRRSYSAVRAIVANPEAPMPKLYPSRLSERDVRDVSAFVESL